MNEYELKRTWFCKCGWTFDEEVGKYLPAEGTEGTANRFCSGCNSTVQMEWRVIENTDPEDELDEASSFCFYCEQLKEPEEVNEEYENYAYPVCNECIKIDPDYLADMDAQDPKWGEHKV